MKLDRIHEILDGVPYINRKYGGLLYEHILRTKPEQCLELGFAHGKSSCYIAAALDELGRGHLTSVDLVSSKERNPNLEGLLKRTGLGKYVTVQRERNSYTWFLKKKIQERSPEGRRCEPLYDFVFIDGPKSWTIDGCAFFCADKLMRENAWILFDDVDWTYAGYEKATGKTATDGIDHRELADDEKREAQIEHVFRLMVMQHPDYSEFQLLDGKWAFARKARAETRELKLHTTWTMKDAIFETVRKIRHAKV